jgi:hypothetical protein
VSKSNAVLYLGVGGRLFCAPAFDASGESDGRTLFLPGAKRFGLNVDDETVGWIRIMAFDFEKSYSPPSPVPSKFSIGRRRSPFSASNDSFSGICFDRFFSSAAMTAR